MSNIISRFKQNNILSRSISAFVLIIIAVILLKSHTILFNVIVISIGFMAFYEYTSIVGRSFKWNVFGVLYISQAIVSLILIRSFTNGSELISFLMINIWATDIGAYVFGITFGGPKIAPKISPAKSWSGAFGGLVLAIIASIIMLHCNLISELNFIYIAALISVTAQVGDILESYFKRQFNVKDSGKIIPGHGGVLDRLDSLMLASIVFLIILLIKMHV